MVSSVSASAAVLSVRQRRMRGNRTATPDLCRFDRFKPSKASSNDKLGLDGAHRAELLDHVVSDEGIDAADFLVGQPRVSLGDGHERAGARSQTPKA